jgi:molybdate transport system ATP-binding protein
MLSLSVDVELELGGGRRVEVAFDTGERAVALIGPNGAGKTTALRAILGFVAPRRGRIALGGRTLFDSAAGIDLPPEQRRIGYVPSSAALFPHLDVLGNVAFGAPSREAARGTLDALGLLALAGRPVATLSGGEAQQISLARALAMGPQALVLDEPLSSLDARIRPEVRALLVRHLAEARRPAVLVTHHAADAIALGGQVVVLEAGRTARRGSPAELQAHPGTEFVRDFFASAPLAHP